MKLSKRFKESEKLIDKDKLYPLQEAVDLLKKVKPVKFDETVEMSFTLGVDPKHADQMVRGSVLLPAGTGKTKRVLVFAKGDSAKEAKEAGADYVGDADFIQKVTDGWLDFDAVVATPDMMKEIGKLGRVLGTRGLMPSPKTGTVTTNISKAVNELKSGKLDFKVNKVGDINLPIGKISFDSEKIKSNATAIIDAILKAKPTAAKGEYIKKAAIAATMSPGIRLDVSELGA